jgi:hypothetical protein
MFLIKKVKASRPCRVRIYESQKHMILDATRSAAQPPSPPKTTIAGLTSNGLILDLVLTDAAIMNGDWIVNPPVIGTTPYNEMVMLVEPPAMVKLTMVEITERPVAMEFTARI